MYRILILTKEPLCLALAKNGLKETISKTKQGSVYFTDSLDIGLRFLAHNKKISISETMPETDAAAKEHPSSDTQTLPATAEELISLEMATGKLDLAQEEKKLNTVAKRTRRKRNAKNKDA